MSDKKTAITATAPPSPTGLAVQGQPQEIGFLEGEDSSDMIIPRAHLFQGTNTESKIFGKEAEPGELYNSVTGEKIGTTKFLVVDGFKDWADIQDNKVVFASKNKSDFQPDDLEWHDHTPPRVQERINFICLFDGEEWPMILRFKKTSLAAGRTLNTMLKLHKGRKMYELTTKERDFEKGSCLVPVIKPAGDPPAEMYALACDLRDSLKGRKVEVAESELDEEMPETDGTNNAATKGGTPF